MHHTATHCNPRIQKTVIVTLLCSVLCVPTASAVILHVTTDAAGDGVGHINVTREQFSEVALPIYESFSSGTQRGYSWGGVGLKVGGKNVTFTNTSLFDYEGNNLDRSAQFIGDGNGMGIRSSNAPGDQAWLVDGKEGFGWSMVKRALVGLPIRIWISQVLRFERVGITTITISLKER
jgi:hypothetical protein